METREASRAKQGAWAAMAGPGTREAMADICPPPKKNVLGKTMKSGGRSGGADSGRRSGGAGT